MHYNEHEHLCKHLDITQLPFFHLYKGSRGRIAAFSASIATFQRLRGTVVREMRPRCSRGKRRVATRMGTAPSSLTTKERCVLVARVEGYHSAFLLELDWLVCASGYFGHASGFFGPTVLRNITYQRYATSVPPKNPQKNHKTRKNPPKPQKHPKCFSCGAFSGSPTAADLIGLSSGFFPYASGIFA